jgi:hypothetical protein
MMHSESSAFQAELRRADTLGELLQANGIANAEQVPQEVRRMYIGSGNRVFYDAENNEREFVFAGYLLSSPPDSTARPTDERIHVVVADRVSGRVQYGAVSPADVPGTGSILGIRRSGGFTYIDTHLTPSAGNLLVLTPDLKLQRELYGYTRAFPGNGSVVFRHSQIHFMRTHSTELSLYDPVTNTEKQIYPPVPHDPVRSDFIQRVREEYDRRGEDWFRVNNHPMDPELFDSNDGPITLDEKANAMAFMVRYENSINDSGDPAASRQDVVVTCSPLNPVNRTQCKERPLASWADALKLSRDAILKEAWDSHPITDELLRRAAANPLAGP